MSFFDDTAGLGSLIGTGIGAFFGGSDGGSIGGSIGGFLGGQLSGSDSGSFRGRISPTTFRVTEPSGNDRFVLSGGGLTTFDTPESLARERRVAGARSELSAVALGRESAFMNNALLEAKLSEIEDKRLATKGGIRAAFGKRRLSGASFEAQLVSQSDAEFAKSKATLRAQEQEKAIANTFRMVEIEFRQANSELDREIAQLGIISGAAQFADRLQFDALRFEQELAIAEATAAGQFFGGASELLSGLIVDQFGSESSGGFGDDGLTSTGSTTAGGFDLTGNADVLRRAGTGLGF